MRARVKATGEILEISEDCSYVYAEHFDKSYNLEQLEILDVKEKIFPKDNPDYWTKLEHQYAGMAMQGMLSGWWSESIAKIAKSDGAHFDIIVHKANELARALVEKLKEKEK